MAARRRDVEEILRQLGAARHGVVTRAQLLGRGLAVHAVDSLVRTRRLVLLARGVYQVGPLPLPYGPAAAAILAAGAGARASHRTAAQLHGLAEPRRESGRKAPRGRDDQKAPRGRDEQKAPRARASAGGEAANVEVSVPRKRRRRMEGIRIHRVRDLPEDEVMVVEGLPVTTPPRTLLDLAEVMDARELEQAYATALRRGQVTPAMMQAMVARHPDHRGAGRWRRLLAQAREPAFTRSAAEEVLLDIARTAGLPRPELNVRVFGHEVDFLWRAGRLVVEVDGYAYHASRHSFAADRRRDAELAAAGYRVLRFTWSDLTEGRLATVARLAQALVR